MCKCKHCKKKEEKWNDKTWYSKVQCMRCYEERMKPVLKEMEEVPFPQCDDGNINKCEDRPVSFCQKCERFYVETKDGDHEEILIKPSESIDE